MSAGASPRLLLVHAHPDDETLATGATMARYAAAGAGVTLVTCTLGQCGEVIPAELAHLSGDALGAHRAGELARAAALLGVGDHRLLAGGRWRDSGMVWVRPGIAGVAADADPRSFALAPLDEAVGALAEVLREVRPHLVLTYDPDGGYRHPDHVQAHRVTTRAVELAAAPAGRPGWAVPRVYWVRVPRSWAEADRERLRRGAPASMTAREAAAPYPPAVVDDDRISVVVAADEHLRRKAAALRAHATQVRVEDDCYALSDGVAHVLRAREAFELAHGQPLPPDPGGPATDLFAGLRLT